MPASNTKTLQDSIKWAQFFVGNRPLNVGNGLEPALTSANTVIQVMMQPPFRWRWNRASVTFATIDPGGWKANTAVAAGYRIKDTNGNMQTVTTAGTTGGTQPTWSTSATTTDGTAVWTESLFTDYVQSIPNFGFIEKAYVSVPSGTDAGKAVEITQILQEMTQDNGTGRFQGICPYLDDNAGNITFRFMPGNPDKLYNVTVIYQKQPALMTGLTGSGGTWPIPDRYGLVYQQGFLGMTYLFADEQAAGFLLQRFSASLLSLAEGLTEQERNAFLNQWKFTIEMQRESAKTSQGLTARSAS